MGKKKLKKPTHKLACQFDKCNRFSHKKRSTYFRIRHNAPRIGTVYSDPTTDDLYSLFQTPRSVLWVAEIDGKPQGCCGIFPTPGLDSNCAELVKFYLSPKIRGKGVGRKLMENCILSAEEMGYKQLYLESMPEFGRAVRIYQMLGFTPLSGPMGHSGHSGCTIWMVKEL